MKTLIMMFLAVTLSTPVSAQVRIHARDGTYLGNLTTNPYDPNSISNPYGRYGSPYSRDSIHNPYGRYGSPYSSQSPNSMYYNGDDAVLYPPPLNPED